MMKYEVDCANFDFRILQHTKDIMTTWHTPCAAATSPRQPQEQQEQEQEEQMEQQQQQEQPPERQELQQPRRHSRFATSDMDWTMPQNQYCQRYISGVMIFSMIHSIQD
jgi:hypothetical protein